MNFNQSSLLNFIPDYIRDFSLFGSTGEAYIIALAVFLIVLIIGRVFHHVLLWRLEEVSKKTSIKLDDVLINTMKRVRWWFYIVLALYAGLWFLEFGVTVWQTANTVFIIAIVYQIVQSVGVLVEYFVEYKMAGDGEANQAEAISRVLTKIIKGVLWVLALLFILSNVGINITSLITGLGIGGVAVALALQTILGDLFSSFAIYFDKPFQVGDFIIVGDKMGTVEAIGIKTTRLRALSGEEIVISNRELTSAQIHNYRGTDEFRGTFNLGVSYQTSPNDLDKAKNIVSEVVKKTDNARLDRVNVTSFEDSSINIDIAFYTNTSDYNSHLSTQHAILIEIKRRFEEEKIDFAYPTRTVYLQK